MSEHRTQNRTDLNLVSKGIETSFMKMEVLLQLERFGRNKMRQRKIEVQRETESVFLRAASPIPGSAQALRDIQTSHATENATYYPQVMKWIEGFARSAEASVGRVILAKLKPFGRIYPHIDHGDYYALRERYHLVICSPEGSQLTCNNQTVVMQEGDLWWLNNKAVHEAFNPTTHDRIHLIFDLLSHT